MSSCGDGPRQGEEEKKIQKKGQRRGEEFGVEEEEGAVDSGEAGCCQPQGRWEDPAPEQVDQDAVQGPQTGLNETGEVVARARNPEHEAQEIGIEGWLPEGLGISLPLAVGQPDRSVCVGLGVDLGKVKKRAVSALEDVEAAQAKGGKPYRADEQPLSVGH